jgi:hypothetical protein
VPVIFQEIDPPDHLKSNEISTGRDVPVRQRKGLLRYLPSCRSCLLLHQDPVRQSPCSKSLLRYLPSCRSSLQLNKAVKLLHRDSLLFNMSILLLPIFHLNLTSMGRRGRPSHSKIDRETPSLKEVSCANGISGDRSSRSPKKQ